MIARQDYSSEVIIYKLRENTYLQATPAYAAIWGRGTGAEERLITHIVTLACEYGRYGYRRVTALLR